MQNIERVWHGTQAGGLLILWQDIWLPQWKMIDLKFPEFGCDRRNLRLGLSTDGISPHGNMSNTHNIWSVVLTNYDLPPFLYMKCKFIILTLLVLSTRQSKNDIDVYLVPYWRPKVNVRRRGKSIWCISSRFFHTSSYITLDCHALLPKIYWSGDVTRVGDTYTQEKYPTYTR